MMEKHQKTKTPTSPAPTTTFIQTDANTFRELVQKMTGSSGNHCCEKPTTSTASPRSRSRPSFKLQQRRHAMRRLELELQSSRSHRCIDKGFSPTHSPVTPLRGAEWSEEEEEKAIADKRFYLHPSPLSTPRGSNNPPELLTLFPLSSPRSLD